MKRSILTTFLTAAIALSGGINAGATPTSTKQERNFIAEGNKLYKENRFAEAEVQYRKALQENPNSEKAQYNLAASLIRQAGSADPNSGNNPLNEAARLLRDVAQQATDIELAEKAFYNLGNMAFNQEQYQQSIDMYKNALRKNPDNDKTRENLRLAQIKLKEQQDNQDNQDQNQNQNQDQQQNQQNQDQNNNQDQNQDQNQNKDKDQNQDQQPQGGDKQDKPQQQPKQQQGGISDANAEKILKAMENEEAATRKRVEAERRNGQQTNKRQVQKPW